MSSTVHPGSPGAEGINPVRAPVVPRVTLLEEEAAVRIEDRVRTILGANPRSLINLIGPPGSGKTMALVHLAATLGAELPVVMLDDAAGPHVMANLRQRPVLLASAGPLNSRRFVTLTMAPWTDDDLAEYLLATHPGRCRTVMLRLRTDPDRTTLNGLPELWRIVLDEMAADDAVDDVDAALQRFLDREMSDPAVRTAAEYRAMVKVAPWGVIGKEPPADVTVEPLRRMLRHEQVRSIVAARRLADGLEDGSAREFLCGRLPRDVVGRVGGRVRSSPAAIRALDAMTQEAVSGAHAMAASILHVTEIGWQPRNGPRPPNLCDAWLAGVQWDGIRLPGCKMSRADLRRASLANADCEAAEFEAAKLANVTWRNAALRAAILRRADCSEANLAAVTADAADFSQCNLTSAVLAGASLRNALFRRANLTRATLCRADLSMAALTGATLDEADLSGAVMVEAKLAQLKLAGCTFGSNDLQRANLSGCDLEGISGDEMNFESADLSGALLTGSVLPAVCFNAANLRGCGLAEIEWEGADLRDADLRESTFHMGSTRSGLVGSTIPCEGSRTGFYTDEFFETDFKAPEEIRKANLRGADLRGAKIDDVDFYLVDLRDACYTPDQAEWFRRCKAILSRE
jgi:uncharacterized protein YjbI with pentapeptide repeats